MSFYEQGKDLELFGDSKQIIYCLNQAARLGNTEAQVKLGDLYLQCNPPDYKKAFKYYKEGANANNQLALCKVGHAYFRGWGGERDLPKALSYLKKSAYLGYTEAMYYLGIIYLGEENYDIE